MHSSWMSSSRQRHVFMCPMRRCIPRYFPSSSYCPGSGGAWAHAAKSTSGSSLPIALLRVYSLPGILLLDSFKAVPTFTMRPVSHAARCFTYSVERVLPEVYKWCHGRRRAGYVDRPTHLRHDISESESSLPEAFLPVVGTCATAATWAVRHLAARALAPLVHPTDVSAAVVEILRVIPTSPPIIAHNQVRD